MKDKKSKYHIYEHYLVLKVLEDFRNFSLEDEEFINQISISRWSDLFRHYSDRSKDLETILDILSNEEKSAKVRFASMLLRKHMILSDSSYPALGSRLSEIYLKATDVRKKITLIYDLLEFKDIADKNKENYFNFIDTHRVDYKNYQLDYYGDEKGLVHVTTERMNNPLTEFHNIHNSKKWIYLYNLSLVTENVENIKSLIDKHFKDETDPFIVKVKEKTLDYLNIVPPINYEEFYKTSYNLVKKTINDNISLECKILDLGSGDSPYIKSSRKQKRDILRVDKQKQSLSDPNFLQQDVNVFLESNQNKFDFIIVNAALHEFWMEPKDNYLRTFINKIISLTNIYGKIYIGDYYYSGTVTEVAFKNYKSILDKTLGHADDMGRFYQSKKILQEIMKHNNIKIINYEEILISNDIERYYFGLLLQKINP